MTDTPELELWIEPESNRYHKGPDTEYAKAQGWIQVVRQDIADERVRVARQDAIDTVRESAKKSMAAGLDMAAVEIAIRRLEIAARAAEGKGG